MIDPPGKARHCTLMLLSAAVLADVAKTEVQKRTLARYTYLFADALLVWSRSWHKQMRTTAATERLAARAKPHVRALANAVERSGNIRDYLVAKRQPLADIREDDSNATSELWASINGAAVSAMCDAAIAAYDALNDAPGTSTPIIEALAIDEASLARLAESFAERDNTVWHIAADTAADLRDHTLPVAQGGNIGRLIAQINDVALHLDTLMPLAPAASGHLPYDWLVRCAIVLELNTLLDLTLGPPPGGRRTVSFTLLDLCRLGRATEAGRELERLRTNIGPEGWAHVRWLRNKISAHVDDQLTMPFVHRYIIGMHYPSVVKLAEHVLDWLDATGAGQQDLKLLVLGERPLRIWPTDRTVEAVGRPSQDRFPGALGRMFRNIDSPFMIGAPGGTSSGVVAGTMAGRAPRPRQPVRMPPMTDDWASPRYRWP